MSLSKNFGKFKQWTTEKLGYAHGTEVSEQFKELEKQAELRRDAADNIYTVAEKYANTLDQKKFIGVRGINTDIPTNALGKTLIDFSTLIGSDSQFSSLLNTVGSLEIELAQHQHEFLDKLNHGFVHEWGHYVAEGKKYTELRRKLESRRLDYDAKLSKVQRAKKEKPELEEEVRASLCRYEEMLSEVETKLSYLLDFEDDGINALRLLVSAQLSYFESSLIAFQKVQSIIGTTSLASAAPRSRPVIAATTSSTTAINTTTTTSTNKSNPSSGTSTPNMLRHTSHDSLNSDRPPLASRSNSYNSHLTSSPSFKNDVVPTPTPPITMSSATTTTVREFDNQPSNRSSTIAPVPIPAVPDQRILRAIYDFVAEADNEISLKTGDLVTFIQEVDAGWWIGEIGGRRGIFPSNYVEEYTPPVVPNPSPPVPKQVSTPTPVVPTSTSNASSFAPVSRTKFGSSNSIHSSYSSQPTSSTVSPAGGIRGGIPAMVRTNSSSSNLSSNVIPSTVSSSVSVCGTCGCDEFTENVFRRGQCNNCFHSH